MITRWAAKCGPVKAPTANATAAMSPNDRTPAQWQSGITSISGPRQASQSSIVRRAPSLFSTRTPKKPASAMPIASNAITTLICVAEPLVVRTNHGRAIQVICAPLVEIVSAASSARSEPMRRTLVST